MVMSATDPRLTEVTILGVIRLFWCFIIIWSRKYSRRKNLVLSYIVSNILMRLKKVTMFMKIIHVWNLTSASFNTFISLKFQYWNWRASVFFLNIDLMWIKKNSFFRISQEKKTSETSGFLNLWWDKKLLRKHYFMGPLHQPSLL